MVDFEFEQYLRSQCQEEINKRRTEFNIQCAALAIQHGVKKEAHLAQLEALDESHHNQQTRINGQPLVVNWCLK